MLSRESQTRKENDLGRGKKSTSVLVEGIGDECPRCGEPTEIREHVAITEKQLNQSIYYSRWFNCTNKKCRTTLIMPDRFKVFNKKKMEEVKHTPLSDSYLLFFNDVGFDLLETSSEAYNGKPPWED